MNIKLVVFDMDGVLVDIKSSWGLIHRHFNVSSANNMLEYLSGKIDYYEFMRRDISLWLKVKSKIHYSELLRIFNNVNIPNESKEVVKQLKSYGLKVAIVTSGVNLLADRVCKALGVDYCLSNKLLFDENGYLLPYGEAVVPLLDKDVIVYTLAKALNLSVKDEVAYVGDSIFDIPVFKKVALSIAFNAKREVIKHATIAVKSRSEIADSITRYV